MQDVIAERAAIDKAVSGKTVCTIFNEAVTKWGDKPALHWKENGDTRTLTWRGYRDEVAAVTLALRSLGFGPGQFGLIMARNAPEHVIADLGIVHAGGAAISVYNTLAPEQIEYVANHSEATVAFVEDEGFLEKFLAIRSSTPKLRYLVLVRGSAPEGVITWESLVAKGREMHAAEPKAFEESWRAVGPEDTISLIYTSGTTGPPKGVVYSHNNILWTLESIQRFYPLDPETCVSYLPLAHVAERFTSQWRGIHLGHEVWLCPDPNLLLPYLLEAVAEVRPLAGGDLEDKLGRVAGARLVHRIDRLGDGLDAGGFARAHVSTGVDDEVSHTQSLAAFHLVNEAVQRLFAQGFVRRGEVIEVGGVRRYGGETGSALGSVKVGDLLFAQRLACPLP